MTGSKALLCPICRRPVGPDAALPFCSERCKLVDLGSWLSGRYHISGAIPDQDRPAAPGAAGEGALTTSENECDS